MALTYANQIGAISGLNQSGSGVSIPEDFVRWAQDILFDRNGLLRRRAPHTVFPVYNQAATPTVTQFSVAGERVVSAFSTLNPLGQRISGLLVTNNVTSRILFLDANNRGTHNTASLSTVSTVIPMPQDAVFDVKNASTTGMWLSFLEQGYSYVSSSNDYAQYYWRGGCGVETTYAAPLAGTFRSGTSATNTGSFGTGLTFTANNNIIPTPGMFVFLVNGTTGVEYYAGTVLSATTTSIILEKDLIRPVYGTQANTTIATMIGAGATLKTYNVRPFIKNQGRGLISGVSGASQVMISGNAGSDAEGHWKSAGVDSTWAIYRANDGAWLGDVAGVTDNTTLTMNATFFPATAITLKADEYTARQYTTGTISAINTNRGPTNVAGIFTATYAGLQWYGNAGDTTNRNRIVFSAYNDPESVDLSANDADSIIIPGLSEMRGLATSASGLIIFMADKTYRLRGNSRFNFSLEELYPEGCLSSMSIVEYGGGVFWASKTGIFLFDGTTVRNLSKDNLGLYYSESIKNYDPQVNRAYGFFHKDYLFMHFNAWKSIYNPIRYEPIYAGTIDGTAAISGFTYDNWDPDFTINDLSPNSNTPIYWNRNVLYSNSSGAGSGLLGAWQQGSSYSNCVTNSSTTVSNFVDSTYPVFVVSNKALTTNVATITTSSAHGYVQGDIVMVAGVDAVFNGAYLVTGAPTTTTFTYGRTNANVTSAAAAGTVTRPAFYGPFTATSISSNANVTGNLVLTVLIASAGGYNNSFAASQLAARGGCSIYITGSALATANGVWNVPLIGSPFVPASITCTNPTTLTVGAGAGGTFYIIPNGHFVAGQGVTYSSTSPNKIVTITSPIIGSTTNSAATISTATTSTVNPATIQLSYASPSFFWGALGYQYIWGPLNQTEGLTFAVYLPTGAISVISNFGFRGVIKQESFIGLKAVVAANAVNPTEFSVVTKSSAGTVATITTSVPHGLTAGTITVSGIDDEFNGNVTLLNINVATTSASGTTAIATIGVGSGHPFLVGHTITVSGITPTGYNGTFAVISTTSTSVSYVNTTTGVQTVAGTITNNNANTLVYNKTINSTFSPINVAPNGTVAQTGVYARLIDVDALLNINTNYTSGTDEVLIENLGMSPNNYIKGPDFYMQTKHYSMGDPILKKWFRQLFLNLYLIDGAVRLDIVDNEDNDEIDITKKRHNNWETFGGVSFTWDKFEDLILPAKLSPNPSTWNNVELLVSSWYNVTNTLYERRKQRMSWRYPTIGFRLYQMNNYRAPKFSLGERPFAVELESWNIGFKPMRASRV